MTRADAPSFWLRAEGPRGQWCPGLNRRRPTRGRRGWGTWPLPRGVCGPRASGGPAEEPSERGSAGGRAASAPLPRICKGSPGPSSSRRPRAGQPPVLTGSSPSALSTPLPPGQPEGHKVIRSSLDTRPPAAPKARVKSGPERAGPQ